METNDLSSISNALLAGGFSTFGSLFGKLLGNWNGWLLSAVYLTFMISCNSYGFKLFAKSLNSSPNSIRPTLISYASGYCVSAFLGTVIFGEQTSFLWYVGSGLMLSGIFVLARRGGKPKDEMKKTE